MVGQLIKKTSLFRSKKGLKSLALSSAEKIPHHKFINTTSSNSPSSLRYTVEPPTPMEDEVTADQALALARALSREPSSPLARVRSRASVGRNGAQILGVPLGDSINGLDEIEDVGSDRIMAEKDEKEGKEEGGGMRKTVKGLVGKLKKHTSKFDLPSISTGSSDDVSGTSCKGDDVDDQLGRVLSDRHRRSSHTTIPSSPPHRLG